MLSEALQRNAKHEARLSNISDLCIVSLTKFQRLKAWFRGLRPLRCSFASLRMTVASIERDNWDWRFRYFFSFTRVKTPRASLSKLSAVPSSPIMKVVTEGDWVAPGNCIRNAPLLQCFNVAGYFAGPN